jgi:hypothetical protein
MMAMENLVVTVSVRGQPVPRSAVKVEGQTIITTGRWLRIASIYDEEWQDGAQIENPKEILDALSRTRPKPDIFAFALPEPERVPRFSAHIEWDNVALIRTSDYAAWWNGLPQESRRNVRTAEKRGVKVRVAPFDDALVQGIKDIYDETPFRQGRQFWHYGKDFETVKKENSTYLDRSDFLGAYLEDELIGFIKLVYVGKTARVMQILSKNRHFDKRPANALIAKAVEICSQKGMSHFAYCRYVYGTKKNSSITEFKRRNGFEEFRFPRYFFPLTVKGAVALRLGLHLSLRERLPGPMIEFLLGVRAKFYGKFRSADPAVSKSGGAVGQPGPTVVG